MGLINKMFEPYDGPALPKSKLVILGIQHTFTMFGATVLVPILTGLNIAVALFMAGLCTLLFHVITKGKVPIFLGSSFAFIAPVIIVSEQYGRDYALGGVVVAGMVYIVVSLLVYIFGVKAVMSFFPPIVTGPIIIIIGLMLAPVAISQAGDNWGLAACSFIVVAAVSLFAKGFIRMLPVLCGLVAGYVIAVLTGNVNFAPVVEAQVFGLPDFTMAKFAAGPILIIAPVAIATVVEHIGDIVAINATCEKEFDKNPGLHRTLLGDGVCSCVSAMFGGPANTTYSENTGVLVLTRAFNPAVMRIAACFAILLGLIPKLSSVIASIPTGVIGGISIVLFGMIAAVGMRTLVENQVNMSNPRNLLIAAVTLVLGLGGAVLQIALGAVSFELSGVALAAIVGIILNKALPEKLGSTQAK
ncbi:MAG: uracil-xanthine permease family protein [Oscillospiraceae bacterium]|nr:uracil-xanthine permease family protein [Oscillospiraceae bacterium]